MPRLIPAQPQRALHWNPDTANIPLVSPRVHGNQLRRSHAYARCWAF